MSFLVMLALWDASLPHTPRYATPTVEPTVWDELTSFVKEVEDVWAGNWARNQETVKAGHAYVQALCVPGARKSMELLSASADENRHQFYQFITRSPWSWSQLQDRLVETGQKHGVFSREGSGIYVDDTALPKTGKHSVGVKRQYCGVLGKTENCQALTTVVWGASAEANRDSVLWPLGMELYLPEEWANDEERREKAGVPDDVTFRTKNENALAILARVRSRVPHEFIGADAAYGSDGAWRKQLREWNEPYVVGVRPTDIRCAPDLPLKNVRRKRGPGRPPNPKLPSGANAKSPMEWAEEVSWETVTWTEGARGTPLTAQVARVRVRITKKAMRDLSDETGWLLLEKRDNELKAWICWGLDDASLETLVRMAHHRWIIEHAFSIMKGELGLDNFEGRKWNGLHHHVTLVMLALAFLQALRLESTGGKTSAPLSLEASRRSKPSSARSHT